jgi:chorismate mutase/prephenate dehydratase
MSIQSVPILYFGEEGSFSHLAANRRFKNSLLQSCPTVEECFDQLRSGKADPIVVPIENASAGMIISTVDQLIELAMGEKSGLAIREALVMKVELSLLARDRHQPIKKFYSHLAPFNHARKWLKEHYPQAEQIIVGSTSEAARRAQKEDFTAAIAGKQTADLYGLEIVRSDVGSEIANQTTFFVVGKPFQASSSPTRTTFIFEVIHRSGSLLAALQVLANEKLNLTKIESRPIQGRLNEYRFLIEFEGSPGDESFHRAMEQLKQVTTFHAGIGSYPVIPLD